MSTNNALAPELDKDALKAQCRALLLNSNTKPHTVQGRRMIHAFWAGVLHTREQLGAQLDPHIVICLMSGRQTELI